MTELSDLEKSALAKLREFTARSKYQPCGMASDVGALAVAELQSRIRSLQEQNDLLAVLVDEKKRMAERLLAKLTHAAMLSLPSPVVVSRAPVVRWVALSSGWHHWPCVTTGAKAPEREPHPLHRAIAVRKEGFPRG